VKTRIRSLFRLANDLLSDDHGGEVIEWVLIAGLIVVATIATVGAFGTKVLAKWTSVNDSM
jgi:pilus assembly protein Flp/PilA